MKAILPRVSLGFSLPTSGPGPVSLQERCPPLLSLD